MPCPGPQCHVANPGKHPATAQHSTAPHPTAECAAHHAASPAAPGVVQWPAPKPTSACLRGTSCTWSRPTPRSRLNIRTLGLVSSRAAGLVGNRGGGAAVRLCRFFGRWGGGVVVRKCVLGATTGVCGQGPGRSYAGRWAAHGMLPGHGVAGQLAASSNQPTLNLPCTYTYIYPPSLSAPYMPSLPPSLRAPAQAARDGQPERHAAAVGRAAPLPARPHRHPRAADAARARCRVLRTARRCVRRGAGQGLVCRVCRV